MTGVGGGDGRQEVVLYPVLLQQAQSAHHSQESRLPSLVHPVCVVQLTGTIEAESHQVAMFAKERAPLVIEKDAIGLNRVLDPCTGLAMLLGVRDDLAEEIEAHQRGLATLPREADGGSMMSFDELADVGLHYLGRHAEVAVRVELFLVEVEAVLAVEVADRAGRLGEDVKGAGAVLRHVRFAVDAIRGTVRQSIGA